MKISVLLKSELRTVGMRVMILPEYTFRSKAGTKNLSVVGDQKEQNESFDYSIIMMHNTLIRSAWYIANSQ